jgi:hypothetical protein
MVGLVIGTVEYKQKKKKQQQQLTKYRYFQKNILKQKIGSKGQLCKEHEATVDHLT